MPREKGGGGGPSCWNTDDTCARFEPCEPPFLGVTKTQGAPQIGQAAGTGPESSGTGSELSETRGSAATCDPLRVRKIEISRCSISMDTRRVRFMARAGGSYSRGVA